jgi:uncharacterized membrane protein YbhN (UPF0104 family)
VNKRIVLTVAKYGLAFGLLSWVVYKNWAPASGGGLRDVWQRHFVEGQPIHWEYLAAAFTIYCAALLLTLLRWHLLVRAQGLSFRVSDAIRLGLVGFFYNTFLPGSVGGDIVKAYALAKEQSRRTVAVATVIMDRIIALWGLFWFVAILGGIFWLSGALEGPAAEWSKFIVLTAGAIVGVSGIVWLLLGLLPQHRAELFAGRLSRLPKVGGSAAEFWRAVWMYRCRQKSVAAALGMAWVGFVGFVLAFWFCALAMSDGGTTQALPSLTQHFLLVPIGLVIMAVPLFPGGAGIGELGYGFLYSSFGFASAAGVAATLIQRVQSWIVALVGYIVYMRMLARAPAAAPAAPPEANGCVGERRRCPEPEATSAT